MVGVHIGGHDFPRDYEERRGRDLRGGEHGGLGIDQADLCGAQRRDQEMQGQILGLSHRFEIEFVQLEHISSLFLCHEIIL